MCVCEYVCIYINTIYIVQNKSSKFDKNRVQYKRYVNHTYEFFLCSCRLNVYYCKYDTLIIILVTYLQNATSDCKKLDRNFI